LKELTTFISFLSDSLFYISNYSYENWLTSFSDATYFSKAADRFFQDASLAAYTDIDLWAQSVTDPSTLYHSQEILSTNFDAYYHAAEIARANGTIRSRMPFKRPLYDSIGPGAHVSPAQSLIRSRFKSAIDKFSTITQTDREAIYDRSLDPARWYLNFFMSEEFALIKRFYFTTLTITNGGSGTIDFTEAWNPERTMLLFPVYLYDWNHSVADPVAIRAHWATGCTIFNLAAGIFGEGYAFYVPISFIEFY